MRLLAVRLCYASLLAILLCVPPAYAQETAPTGELTRTDVFRTSDPGVRVFVREVVGPDRSGVPVLLVHGGGPGGLASFDLPVPGYSLAADLAWAGHPAYIVSVRGWEQSSRPAALEESPTDNPVQVTSPEATRDLRAALDWARERQEGRDVALVGWATGGQWSAYLAANDGEGVAALVTLNSLMPSTALWPLEEAFIGATAAYRIVTVDGFLNGWNNSIPGPDKAAWRDPAVAGAYALTAVEADPTAYERTPASARIPTGYRAESLQLAQGEPLWDSAAIRVPYTAMRGERDFWSRPADLDAAQRLATNAPRVDTLTIPDATHYLFLDRPERGRQMFVDRLLAFLAALNV